MEETKKQNKVKRIVGLGILVAMALVIPASIIFPSEMWHILGIILHVTLFVTLLVSGPILFLLEIFVLIFPTEKIELTEALLNLLLSAMWTFLLFFHYKFYFSEFLHSLW